MKKRPQQQRPCSGKRLTWMWEEGRKEKLRRKCLNGQMNGLGKLTDKIGGWILVCDPSANLVVEECFYIFQPII